MNKLDIALFILSNIGSFLIGGYFYMKEGLKIGYGQGSKDQGMMFGLAITRAFKPNEQDALDKVSTEYKQLATEFEQQVKELTNAR